MKPMTAPGGPHHKRPRGLRKKDTKPAFVAHVGKATTVKGIGHQIENYVTKTPGPLFTEHKFRDAENFGGPEPDFLPIGVRTGGWEKPMIHGYPATHRAYLENEKHIYNHALDFRNTRQ